MMADIEFLDLSEAEQYTVFYEASHNNNYAAYVRGRRCVDDESLFKEFSAAFQFPYYFGMNVAAFDECMTDLSWLSFEGIFLLIDHFGDVYKGRKADQNWLCDILKQFQREWNARGVKMRVIICGQYVLTAVNGNTIIYEGQTYNESTGEIEGAATGNPTSYYIDGVANTLTWTQGRQLARVSKPGAGVTLSSTYTYDADGIRTSKSVPINRRGLKRTYSYVTQNGKIVRQSWVNNTIDFIYDESGRPFALVYTNGPADPVVYYYVLNLQGDVVGLTDASGTFVAQYTYNAWGEILSSTGDMAGINPLRYRGYYYDFETGFYYLQSRYYDPANHRFINADSYASTGQGIAGTNMFAYCKNNPVIFKDNSGESAESVIGLFKILYIYFRLHQCVQKDIIMKYKYMNLVDEVTVKRTNGTNGRMDLYSHGLVWEIKHGENPKIAKDQANSYVGGTITSRKIDKGKLVKDLGDGGIFEGSCSIVIFGDIYDISYNSPTDGVVLYEFNKRQEQEYELVPQTEKSYAPMIPFAFVPVPAGQPVGGFFPPGALYPWVQQVK